MQGSGAGTNPPVGRCLMAGSGVKRSGEQNDCLHKWCTVIAEHLNADRAVRREYWAKRNAAGDLKPEELEECAFWLVESKPNSQETVKEMIKALFGPRARVTAGRTVIEVIKPSKRWTKEEATKVLSEVEAWAATDMSLELSSE